MKLSRRSKAILWLLLNTVLWGAAFAVVKPALDYTTPIRYLWYRYIFASIFSLPIFWYFRESIQKNAPKIFPKVAGIELIGTTLALVLLYTGLNYTTSIEANLLAATHPLFLTIGGIFFLREVEERHEWFGLIISFLGTALLAALPLLENGHTWTTNSLLGNTLILSSNLLNMAYFPLAKKAYHKYPKFMITSLGYLVGLVSFGGLALWEMGFSLSRLVSVVRADATHPEVWLAGLYMALFGSILGLTAYIKGQDGIEASEASLFYYLQPLVAIPLGVFLLGEGVTKGQLLALAVILFGVWVAQRRKRK